MEHKDLVREEFTRQANDYATAPAILDADHLRKLVEIVAPPPDARVLEVATGPGRAAQDCREDAREARNHQRQLPEGRRRVASAVQGRRIRRRRVPLRGSSFR